MKKKTQFIDIVTTIKRSLIAFVSICMFVALAIAIYTGIGWSGEALVNSVDDTLIQGNYADLQISFPYGVNDDDLAKLADVDGVDEINGIRCFYETVVDGDESYQYKISEINDTINVFSKVEGKVPSKAGEIAITGMVADTYDLEVGDTFSFETDDSGSIRQLRKMMDFDTESDDVADLDDNEDDDSQVASCLTTDTFTVTAIVEHPESIQKDDSMYGVSPLNGKNIYGYMYVTGDSFDDDAFLGYTDVLIRSDALRAYMYTEDAYADAADELLERVKPVADEIALEKSRSIHAQSDNILEAGENKIADAQTQIDDAETQIREKEEEISSGSEEIKNGETTLENSKRQYKEGKAELDTAGQELADADTQITEGQDLLTQKQAEYDAAMSEYTEGKAQLEAAKAELDEKEAELSAAKTELDKAQAEYDEVSQTYNEGKNEVSYISEGLDSGTLTQEEAVAHIRESGYLDKLSDLYHKYQDQLNDLDPLIDEIENDLEAEQPKNAVDTAKAAEGVLEGKLTDAKSELDENWEKYNEAENLLNDAKALYDEKTELAEEAEAQLADAKNLLSQKQSELESGKARYESGLNEYNSAKAQLDFAAGEISSGESQLEEAKSELADGEQKLNDAKNQVEEGKSELELGKNDLETFRQKSSDIPDYQCFYQRGSDHLSVRGATSINDILKNVRYAMAGLFVIVGLLVCYFAILRIVHDQLKLIGTMKAIGFRDREILKKYLSYTGLTLVLGCILGGVLGFVLVEKIITDSFQTAFSLVDFLLVFDLKDYLFIAAVEIVLLLFITFLATKNVLRRNAVELLAGEKPPTGKERFYEKFKLWQRLSLISKIIVNNFFTDKRRVLGTFVGIMGCTSLLVTAFTLNDNILGSFNRQFKDLYHFKYMASYNSADRETKDEIQNILDSSGYDSVNVMRTYCFVDLPNGNIMAGHVTVYDDAESFSKLVNLIPETNKEGDPYQGIWMSYPHKAYFGDDADKDGITIMTLDGSEYTMDIDGYYEYYVNSDEIVMSADTYETVFGKEYQPNTYLINTGDDSYETLAACMNTINDKVSLINYYKEAESAYDTFQNISKAVVLIYSVLSVLIAILVLLNLLAMFVEEKKKELIVMMINGFSLKTARRYISGDTVMLTIWGILGGLVLGTIIGEAATAAFDTIVTFYMRQIDIKALLIGTAGTAILSFIMTQIALSRINRFKLPDINN